MATACTVTEEEEDDPEDDEAVEDEDHYGSNKSHKAATATMTYARRLSATPSMSVADLATTVGRRPGTRGSDLTERSSSSRSLHGDKDHGSTEGPDR